MGFRRFGLRPASLLNSWLSKASEIASKPARAKALFDYFSVHSYTIGTTEMAIE